MAYIYRLTGHSQIHQSNKQTYTQYLQPTALAYKPRPTSIGSLGAGPGSMSSSVAGGAAGCGGAGGGSGGGGGGPCGACKFLRRKCASDCIFAPHFDQDQGAVQFAAVHRVFGASNVAKLLNYLPIDKRTEAVITICFEAQARLRDPVYGCVSHIFSLQQQIVNLQSELNYVQNHLAAMEQQQQVLSPAQPLIPMTGAFTELQPASNIQANVDKSYLLPTEQQQQQYVHMGESSGGAGGSGTSGGTDDLYELARGLLNRHGGVDGSEEPPQPKHQ